MTKSGKRPRKRLLGRPRKRGPLDPITVGSKLTKRTRQPAIWDDEYRESMLRGELIDSRVLSTTARPFGDFEIEVRNFCVRYSRKRNCLIRSCSFTLVGSCHPNMPELSSESDWIT